MENLLILFAKYPEAGRVKTRLGKEIGFQAAANLYETLLKQLIENLGENWGENGSDYDLNLFVDDQQSIEAYQEKLGRDLTFFYQSGSDLGEKMTQAFDNGFQRGYQRVILIGSDIPFLDSKAIKLFFDDLTRQSMVIGPTLDGGYYMIGFQRGVITYPFLFQGIPWSRPTVFDETLKKARSHGLDLSIEKMWFDIDTSTDLDLYRQLQATGLSFSEMSPLRPGERCPHNETKYEILEISNKLRSVV